MLLFLVLIVDLVDFFNFEYWVIVGEFVVIGRELDFFVCFVKVFLSWDFIE